MMNKVIPMSESAFRNYVTDMARRQVGKSERPNNHIFVWYDIDSVGPNLDGSPWCAGFIAWVIWICTGGKKGVDNSGLESWDHLNAFFTPAMYNFAVKHGATKRIGTALNGDIYLFDFPDGNKVDHTGFAWPNPRTSTYRAIEGNTNGAGAAEGGGVLVKERPGRQIRLVIDLIKWVKAMGWTFAPPVPKPAPPAPKPTPAPKPIPTRPLLKLGSKGKFVVELQRLLIRKGYSCGTAGADGDFGKGTRAAVVAFQKKNRLSADGEVGTNTWTKLMGTKIRTY